MNDHTRRYRRLLGPGGMGRVWRAFGTATERAVAVTMLAGHMSDGESSLHRIRRQRRHRSGS